MTWSENVCQFTWHANSDKEVKKTDYSGRSLGWCHKKVNNPVLKSKDIQKLCNWMWDPVFLIHQSTANSKGEKHRDIMVKYNMNEAKQKKKEEIKIILTN